MRRLRVTPSDDTGQIIVAEFSDKIAEPSNVVIHYVGTSQREAKDVYGRLIAEGIAPDDVIDGPADFEFMAGPV